MTKTSLPSAIAPAHAAKVWAVGDLLFLELPSTKGLRSHTINLPNNPEGLAQALNIITHRTAKSEIGEAGDPTQYQVDKKVEYHLSQVRRVGVQRTEQSSSTVKGILRQMGLI